MLKKQWRALCLALALCPAYVDIQEARAQLPTPSPPPATNGHTTDTPAPLPSAWLKLSGGPTYKIVDPKQAGKLQGMAVGASTNNAPHSGAGSAASGTLESLDMAELRIPVTLVPRELPAEKINLRLVSVRFDDGFDARAYNAFASPKPHLIYPSDDQGPAISISMDLSKALKQGIYIVDLEATLQEATISKANNIKPLTIEIQIIHPSASLRGPATLYINRTVNLLGQVSELQTPLILDETSGLSRLRGLAAHVLAFTDEKKQPVDGMLAVTPPPDGEISARDSATLGYSLKGNLPLGVSTGAIEVSAPQLTQNITINVEVKTHRASWIIVLVTLLGLICGFIARIWLKGKIDRDQVRVKGYDVLNDIDRATQQHPDVRFQKAVQPQRKALEEALKGRDIDKMNAGITAANDAFTTAVTELNTRRAMLQTQLDSFERIVLMEWQTPDAIRMALSQTYQSEQAMRADLFDRDNISAAVDLLIQPSTPQSHAILNELITQIESIWTSWADAPQQQLTDLSLPTTSLPATVTVNLKPALDQLTSLLRQVKSIPLATKPEDITPTLLALQDKLQAMHDVCTNLDHLLHQLAIWLQSVLDMVFQILNRQQGLLPDPQAVVRLRQEGQEFINALNEEEKQRAPLLTTLTKASLASLHNTWRTALIAQISPSNPAKDAILKQIDDQKYEEAAQSIVNALQSTARKTSDSNAADISETPASAFFGVWVAQRSRFTGFVPAMKAVAREPLPAPVETLRVRALHDLLMDNVLNFIIVGLLIATVAWAVYSDKFVGTLLDLLGIFFWAFGLNVSLDVLSQQAANVKKPA